MSGSKYNFKTFDEQIKLLESRNLTISNKAKLKNYLMKYNYENIINNYNKFFFYNEQSKRYKNGVTSCGIINLFNYDRKISMLVLNEILDIEREVATAIVYLLPSEYRNILPQMEYGQILLLNNEEWKLIFPRKTYLLLDENKKPQFSYLPRDVLSKYAANESESWIKKYGSVEHTPLWSLSIFWTFGTLVDILKSVDIKFTQKVIKYVFKDKPCSNMKHFEFIAILDLFRKIRNRICHNNIIYSFEYKNNDFKHLRMVLSNFCGLNKRNVRLYGALSIMELFNPPHKITKKIYKEWKTLKENGKTIILKDGNKSNDSIVYDIVKDYSQLK